MVFCSGAGAAPRNGIPGSDDSTPRTDCREVKEILSKLWWQEVFHLEAIHIMEFRFLDSGVSRNNSI